MVYQKQEVNRLMKDEKILGNIIIVIMDNIIIIMKENV